MKLKAFRTNRGDTSMLDVLAIVGAAIVIAGLVVVVPNFIQNRRHGDKARRIRCVSNLKQISISFIVWASDHRDKFPMQVSTNAGGAMELLGTGTVAAQFIVISNELSTPKILSCPTDVKRAVATQWTNFYDTNLSYFVVPEANETLPQMLLTGDRNLASSAVPLKAGLFTFKASTRLSWTADIHKHQGNLGFADGSVQQVKSQALQSYTTNALQAYNQATTSNSFLIAIP